MKNQFLLVIIKFGNLQFYITIFKITLTSLKALIITFINL